MDVNQYHSDRFARLKKSFADANCTYRVEIAGSSKKIIYAGQEMLFPFIFKTEGKHLISQVRKDIESNFMPQNPDFDYGVEQTWKSLDFNIPSIRASLGRVITGIDINDCYWFTAYHLGIISKKIFLRGLVRDKWKSGRNMAIGALATKIYTQDFEGDTLVNNKSCEVFPGGTGLNNWIKNRVWEVFSDIFKKLGDEYLMFYVDCIWIRDDTIKASEVIAMIKDAGYNSKANIYELSLIDHNKVELISIKDEPEYNKWLAGDQNPRTKPRTPVRHYFYGTVEKEG